MTTAASQHYENLLAPIYVWMCGGWEAALAQGEADIASLGLAEGARRQAVDLGAGFGMHAIPLARRGYAVLAIDTSEQLLRALSERAGGLPVRTITADLGDFAEHSSQPADLFLCMGDTITHLESREAVARLFAAVASAIAPAGVFVLTFRDYRTLPAGANRFIPVRSDADRILTCFLEDAGEHILVHDILHERGSEGWTMNVSSYPKLRLDPAWVVESLEAEGFSAQRSAAPRGMVRVTATAS
jgi:SAM-dependent methyltransferase